MKHRIPELDEKGLREFALLTSAIVVALFGVALPWLFGLDYPWWPWALALLLVIWGLAAAATLGPVYRTWMRFGLLMSSIMTPLIMGLVFFVMITPLALVMKLIRRDPMARSLDSLQPSYRVTSKKAPRSNMERPY